MQFEVYFGALVDTKINSTLKPQIKTVRFNRFTKKVVKLFELKDLIFSEEDF